MSGERPSNERLKEFPNNAGASNHVVFECDSCGLVRRRREVPSTGEASNKPRPYHHFDRRNARPIEANIFRSHAKSVPSANCQVNAELSVRCAFVKFVALGEGVLFTAARIILGQIE